MYVEVALPISLHQNFVYRLDSSLHKGNPVGKRVLVHFNKKKYFGFVVGTLQKAPDNLSVKDVLHIDEFHTFTEREIEIIKAISEHYLSPVGLTAYYFAPNYLKGKKLEDELLGKIFKLNLDQKLPTKLSNQQRKLVEFLSDMEKVSYLQLIQAGFIKSTIKSLLKMGILKEDPSITASMKLNQSQENIYSIDTQSCLKKGIYTLWGMSDRERVSISVSLIKKYLQDGSSCLIIFPSISSLNLYHQLIFRYFDKIYLYHDAISPKKQFIVWKEVQEKPSLILGTLSSLLIPAKNLKLVIVELEHSGTYRSMITPKFDAKMVVYLLWKYKSISTIYSDRVPSLESYILTQRKIAKPLTKPKRYRKSIEVRKFEGINKTLKLIESILRESESTLIVANKSYYASFVHCERCGFEWMCEKCRVPLRVVLEEDIKVLRCPKCRKVYRYSKNCPDCDHPIKEDGFGRDRVLRYLQDRMFSDVSLLEDNIDTKVKITSSLEGKLIFERFDTVINLYPDFLESIDSFTAREEFFRTVVSPYFVESNRYILISNREDVEGMLREDKSIDEFYSQEIEFRRKYGYPPLKNYIKLQVIGKESVIQQVDSILKEEYSEGEIAFRFVSGDYGKFLICSKNKKPLIEIYNKFSGRAKLSMEVNPKSI